MKAAVVRDLGRPPVYDTLPEPVPEPGEVVVAMTAVALTPLALGRASGTHYSSVTELPFVPGIDGVGRTPDGRRVYCALPRPPLGTLAERVPVSPVHTVPLPDTIDDATAAAAGNPGMSCWVPLTLLAPIRPGESVLVNGATGTAGRMAVQVAKHLGARSVVATGRDPVQLRALRELGADTLLPLGRPLDELRSEVRKAAREARIGVVLDYLWGPSGEAILSALGGPDAPRGPARVRYVQVGSVTGPTITLAGSLLRSSGVEIVGTGLGSSSDADLVAGIGQFLRAFPSAGFRIEFETHPLSEVEQVWDRARGGRRVVMTIP